MKKILSLALVMIAGVTISFAQTATSNTTSTTTSGDEVQSAAPAVKAVDVNQSAKKCTTTSSCCKSGNKASAATTTSTTTTADTEANAEKSADANSCKTVSIGTSAVKPATATVTDPEN